MRNNKSDFPRIFKLSFGPIEHHMATYSLATLKQRRMFNSLKVVNLTYRS